MQMHLREFSRKVATMKEPTPAGIPADSLAGAAWRKSSYSGAVGNCVELAPLPAGQTAVRNSRDPHGPALLCSRAGITAFLSGTRTGEFDGVAR